MFISEFISVAASSIQSWEMFQPKPGSDTTCGSKEMHLKKKKGLSS